MAQYAYILYTLKAKELRGAIGYAISNFLLTWRSWVLILAFCFSKRHGKILLSFYRHAKTNL